jgi:hypothetical protein
MPLWTHLDPTKLMSWRLAALAELESTNTQQEGQEGEAAQGAGCGPAVSTYLRIKGVLAR